VTPEGGLTGPLRLEVEGHRVTRLVVDYAVAFEFQDVKEQYTIRIEGEFRIDQGGAESRCLLDHPSTLGAATTLLHDQVRTAEARQSGELVLCLESGAVLRVAPAETIEAWEMFGSSGARVVCLPGGGLAVWSGTAARQPM